MVSVNSLIESNKQNKRTDKRTYWQGLVNETAINQSLPDAYIGQFVNKLTRIGWAVAGPK